MVCLDRFPRIALPLCLGAVWTGCLVGCDEGGSGSLNTPPAAEHASPVDAASPEMRDAASPEMRDAATAPDATLDGELPSPEDAAVVENEPRTLEACAEGAAERPMPKTIAETVARINDMPMPVTISCFVASLPRPLQVVATDSAFSAQPANGRQSPRLFLITDSLVLSVVPDGPGGHLLEFGEFVSETSTIKGEIAFPVTEPLAETAPYDRLLYNENLTVCGFCHRTEQPHPTIEGAFTSEAFRPEPGTEVPLAELRGYAATACDDGAAPERCRMMRALFSLGPVVQGFFDEELPKFFP